MSAFAERAEVEAEAIAFYVHWNADRGGADLASRRLASVVTVVARIQSLKATEARLINLMSRAIVASRRCGRRSEAARHLVEPLVATYSEWQFLLRTLVRIGEQREPATQLRPNLGRARELYSHAQRAEAWVAERVLGEMFHGLWP